MNGATDGWWWDDDDGQHHVSCAPAGARGVWGRVPVGALAGASFPPATFRRPAGTESSVLG